MVNTNGKYMEVQGMRKQVLVDPSPMRPALHIRPLQLDQRLGTSPARLAGVTNLQPS